MPEYVLRVADGEGRDRFFSAPGSCLTKIETIGPLVWALVYLLYTLYVPLRVPIIPLRAHIRDPYFYPEMFNKSPKGLVWELGLKVQGW